MKKLSAAAGAAVIVVAIAGATAARADPADATLEIDGTKIATEAKAAHGLPFDKVYSGWRYREKDTRAMEADSFENPGMLSVEQGEELWNKVEGAAGKSCASCHNDASKSMRGVAARYPEWDPHIKRPVDVELRINQCRKNRMRAEPYKPDSDQLIALTAYVKHQSLGMPIKLDLSKGDMKSWWERGKKLYHTRLGQLDFACASCHEKNAGHHLRADHLSQGQVNGFPLYRLKNGMSSVQHRFRGCMKKARAKPFPENSDEMIALETYVTWRGTGLSVETPAVRN